MVEDVDVSAERPYFLAGYETEGLGGKRLRAAEGGFEDAGEVGFQIRLSSMVKKKSARMARTGWRH
jgi:hypothetical protein